MIYLIRGIPGAGKSYIARKIADEDINYYLPILEADNYFMKDGVYNFDPSKLPAAHKACQDSAREWVMIGTPIIVANTFTQRWEMEPYLKIAEEFSVKVCVIDIFDGGLNDSELAARNVHGVPIEAIAAMRNRWEYNWKEGNPLPPWERK